MRQVKKANNVQNYYITTLYYYITIYYIVVYTVTVNKQQID